MIKNLSFQWENDSLAKSIITLFAPFLSNNEACAMMMKQSEMEVLHALTYSEIIRQCILIQMKLSIRLWRTKESSRGWV